MVGSDHGLLTCIRAARARGRHRQRFDHTGEPAELLGDLVAATGERGNLVARVVEHLTGPGAQVIGFGAGPADYRSGLGAGSAPGSLAVRLGLRRLGCDALAETLRGGLRLLLAPGG